MKTNPLEVIERQEIIDKLKENGYKDLVEALLGREKKVYTKKGRLNKSGTCRVLGWKPKELEDILKECRELLRDDFPHLTEDDDEED